MTPGSQLHIQAKVSLLFIQAASESERWRRSGGPRAFRSAARAERKASDLLTLQINAEASAEPIAAVFGFAEGSRTCACFRTSS